MLSQLFRFILNKTAAKVKNIPVAASFGKVVLRKCNPRNIRITLSIINNYKNNLKIETAKKRGTPSEIPLSLCLFGYLYTSSSF